MISVLHWGTWEITGRFHALDPLGGLAGGMGVSINGGPTINPHNNPNYSNSLKSNEELGSLAFHLGYG